MWEDACQGIDAREECLKNVEIFEENASNPNRFFAKGTYIMSLLLCSLSAITTPTLFPVLRQAGAGGSAAARLQEAKQRARLLKELDEASKRVSHSITELQRKYGDVLLYKVGRAGQGGAARLSDVV